MIKAIIHHVPYRIYDDDPLTTESGDIQFYAEDAKGCLFILVYDRVPNTTNEYRHPKEILDPSVVPALINLYELIDAIYDEIHNNTVEISHTDYQTKWLKYLKGE